MRKIMVKKRSNALLLFFKFILAFFYYLVFLFNKVFYFLANVFVFYVYGGFFFFKLDLRLRVLRILFLFNINKLNFFCLFISIGKSLFHFLSPIVFFLLKNFKVEHILTNAYSILCAMLCIMSKCVFVLFYFLIGIINFCFINFFVFFAQVLIFFFRVIYRFRLLFVILLIIYYLNYLVIWDAIFKFMYFSYHFIFAFRFNSYENNVFKHGYGHAPWLVADRRMNFF
jgi:hypothetical protein